MTTARHAAPTPDKQRRRTKQRRIGREELIAVGVLLAILIVTVVLLGLQWLDAGSSTTAVGQFPHVSLEVHA